MKSRARAHGLGALVMRVVRSLVTVVGAVVLTFAFFLVLPLFQTIGQRSTDDMIVRDVDTSRLPEPPRVAEPEPEEEEEKPEEEPPELEPEVEPLTLEQMELALSQSVAGAWTTGDYAVKLATAAAGQGRSVDELFSFSELDQKPRVVHQPEPSLSAALRRKTPGAVNVIFVVNERGRVESPIVRSASDSALEAPVIAAVKQWRFEPGQRNGKPVRFRMKVTVTLAKTE